MCKWKAYQSSRVKMDLPVVNHEDYFAKIGDDHKFPINKFGEIANYLTQKKIVSKELGIINTSLKLSKSLSSNKELTYRILAQVASSVPNRVRFDKVEFKGTRNLTIQGVAASDQDILKFIDNLSKQKLVEQAS